MRGNAIGCVARVGLQGQAVDGQRGIVVEQGKVAPVDGTRHVDGGRSPGCHVSGWDAIVETDKRRFKCTVASLKDGLVGGSHAHTCALTEAVRCAAEQGQCP